MESEAQKVEAMKKNAKYRRHVMKKRKHERNMAQAREDEGHRAQYRKMPEVNSHRVLGPAAKMKKVTSGRLSVPRGLFLKGKASSILKKTSDTYLNPLNYARKKEKLGQIIKIGMDQEHKIGKRVHPIQKRDKDPVKPLPKETEVRNDETEGTQEAKRKKDVDRIKTVLGLADPAPSFMPSPLADTEDTQFAARSSPTLKHPLVKMKALERSKSPGPSPYGFDSPRGVRTPDMVPSPRSCNALEVDEKLDEMDDLFLEKLVSDIGLFAWNSQKPSSEPYENCDARLIKEIMSLREETLKEVAKYNKANKAVQARKVSETITSVPPGLPQSPPNPADFKIPARYDGEESYRASHKKTGFPTTKGKVRWKTVTAQSGSVEYNTPDDCYRGLRMGQGAELHPGGTEGIEEEPAVMVPLPADTSFVSPSTPPIAAHAFDPKAFMQNVEVERGPQEKIKYPASAGCSTGGGCRNRRPFDTSGSSRHFYGSEDEFNADDYDTALSQCCDAEVSARSDDSDVSCNLYKYRRAMY